MGTCGRSIWAIYWNALKWMGTAGLMVRIEPSLLNNCLLWKTASTEWWPSIKGFLRKKNTSSMKWPPPINDLPWTTASLKNGLLWKMVSSEKRPPPRNGHLQETATSRKQPTPRNGLLRKAASSLWLLLLFFYLIFQCLVVFSYYQFKHYVTSAVVCNKCFYINTK